MKSKCLPEFYSFIENNAMNNKTSPAATPYEWIGGEPRVQELVTRFYDLMDLEPKYQTLREIHHQSLDGAREKLFLFLSGWLGGPSLYIEKYGHPRLRARHMPFKVDTTGRDQWVACMAQAMREIEVSEELFQKLVVSFYGTAEWMRNQPDELEGPPQMPNQAAMGLTGVPNDITQKLQKIAAEYEVRI